MALPTSMVNALINFTIAALIYFSAISSDSFAPVALTILAMSLNLLVLIFGEPIFEKSQKFSAQTQTVTQQMSGGLERRLSSHHYLFFRDGTTQEDDDIENRTVELAEQPNTSTASSSGNSC